MPIPHRIDVHHHIVSPGFVAELKSMLQPPTLNWTPERSIEDMDKAGVATAITSVTTPGVWIGDHAQGRRLARDSNDYAARLAADFPGRFGVFAAVPLPDIEASLHEIEYGLDVLKADGIALFTSYRDNWLGDPAFEPVMAELNRRKAVVHVHPTAANCCKNLIPGMAPGVMEYGTDTTRAIMSVMWSGHAAKFPDIRFIWSHAGGTAPFLAGRIDGGSRNLKDKMPQGAMHEMKKLYYDTAGAANAGAIASLLKLVASDHIMFGTDFPPGGSSAQVAKQLAELGLDLTAADMRNIDRDNAVRLIPRLAKS
jgi:predicted TIM-barrel fold metal-dependent hydrolase